MKVNAEIVDAMAAALNEVAPADLWATPSPDGIRINAGARVVRTVSTDGYVDDVLEVEQFALIVLEVVQELMIERVRQGGWPPADPTDPDASQGARHLSAPQAEEVEGQLRWWFGNREHPSLCLSPVSLQPG